MESNHPNHSDRPYPHRPPHDRQNPVFLKREIHFTIEAPNGDQIPLRYKPEMTVDMLFQHACKRFSLNPEEHYIVFNNKEMELRDSMKNFNINQNSVLKIYRGRKVTSSTSDIFVSVRIRDCRIGTVFRAVDTLWDILNKLLAEQSYDVEMVPIVIYLKHEFIGEEILKQVRLKDIGITQGSCVIRFLQLKQEDLDQRKMKEDEDTMATLESLELKAAGPTTDAGLRSVHFRLLEDELETDNIQFIGERKALAFRLPEANVIEELMHEDYFDLMLEEINALFAEVAKKRGKEKAEVVDFVKAELDKLKDIRYDFDDTLVRVQFPDRTCVQLLFLPEERVGDLREFLKKFLKDPYEDFELYCDNPRRRLDDSVTFGELKLVPVARVFFERKTAFDQYLNDEVLLSLAPYDIIKEASLMLRGESLDRFLLASDERDSLMRKSTGGFLSKFLRSSRSSSTRSTSRGEGSRSYSKHYSKKQSTFQPRTWSRGSVAGQKVLDDDDDEDLGAPSTSDGTRLPRHSTDGMKLSNGSSKSYTFRKSDSQI